MSHQYATLEDTVYFWFGANDTSGSGADGATPVFDVRLGGAAANAAPTLSGNATLLTHVDYPAGAHEVAIAATAANGFAAGNTYGVFCTLLVDSQNPTGFVGSFKLAGVPATLANGAHGGAAATLTLLSAVVDNTAGIGVSVSGTSGGLAVAASAGYGIGVSGTNGGVVFTGSGGPGFEVEGTTFGFQIKASAGPAMSAIASAGNNHGVEFTGFGNGHGAYLLGGAEGNGIYTVGGVTSGSGIVAVATTEDQGMALTAAGAGRGLLINGGTTGEAIYAISGAASGLRISGATHGIEVAASAGPGVEIDGTTFGLQVDASAGVGTHVGGTTIGLDIDASAGPGMDIDGTTFGVDIAASAGDGIQAVGTGGYDIDADIHGGLDGTVGTVTTLSNLPAIPNDWLTAAGVKADAVTKIQLGLATPTNITAASGVALSATGADLILKTSTFALAVADAIWDEVLTGATHNVVNSAGRRLRELGAVSVLSGTAVAGTGQTITLDASASVTANIYNQNLIVLMGGTGTGQARLIVEYTAAKVVTVDRSWEVNPDATSEYQIIAFSGILLATNGLAQAGGAASITLAASALAIANSYVGCAIYLGAGTGAGQTRLITAYTVGRVATVSPAWDTAPDNTSIYKVLPVGRVITESFGAIAKGEINAEILDCLQVDTPIDGRTIQSSLRIIAAAAIGEVSGAGTGTEVFLGLDGATTRATVTVNVAGNRTHVVYA